MVEETKNARTGESRRFDLVELDSVQNIMALL